MSDIHELIPADNAKLRSFYANKLRHEGEKLQAFLVDKLSKDPDDLVGEAGVVEGEKLQRLAELVPTMRPLRDRWWG